MSVETAYCVSNLGSDIVCCVFFLPVPCILMKMVIWHMNFMKKYDPAREERNPI